MVFLPGDHVLDTNITVANVARLIMRGGSSSDNRTTVVCSGSVGLSFTSIVDFKIDSLAFTSCSRKYSGTFHVSGYALLLHFVHAELVNCSFHGNLGTALVVKYTNITLAGVSEFIHNHWYEGGGIIALTSNLTFTGNTTFFNNSALWYGPFICCRGPGGAISASYNTNLSFRGTSNFINNSAAYSGSAIFAIYNTVITFNGNNDFINNSAIHEVGGAIYTSGNTTLSFNRTNNFINNSADNGDGGAIYASDKNAINFNGTSNFINNSAQIDGGAIYTLNNAVLSLNGTHSFTNNSAANGGAIVTSLSVLTLNGTSTFLNNYAVHGGAIYAKYNSTMAFSGTIHFTNNGGKRSTNGGGVYMDLKSTFSILPNTTMFWENNHATIGGAICSIFSL